MSSNNYSSPYDMDIDQKWTSSSSVMLTLNLFFLCIFILLYCLIVVVGYIVKRKLSKMHTEKKDEQKEEKAEKDAPSMGEDNAARGNESINRKLLEIRNENEKNFFHNFPLVYVFFTEKNPVVGMAILLVWRFCITVYCFCWLVFFWKEIGNFNYFLQTYQYYTIVTYTVGSFTFLIGFFVTSLILISYYYEKNLGDAMKVVKVLYFIWDSLYDIGFIYNFGLVLLYWCIVYPVAYGSSEEEFPIWQDLNVHCFQFLFLLVDIILLPRKVFKFRNIGLSGIGGVSYMLWLTIIVKSGAVRNFPYFPLMSYDVEGLAWLFRIGAVAGVLFLHFLTCCFSYLRNFLTYYFWYTKCMPGSKKNEKLTEKKEIELVETKE